MDSEEGRAVSGKRPYKKRSLKQSFSEPKLKRAKGSFGLAGKTRSDGSCIVKGNWTDSEDERLIELVHQSLEDKKNYKVAIASTRWSEIAKELPGRVGKQCRERWHNHLRPDINKGRWSFCEEVVIYLCWRVWNSQWARISRLLDGRSDNRVKNHWNCHMKRRLTRDKPYFSFMEETYNHFHQIISEAEDDDFEDGQFRDMLIPLIENFLSERQHRIDRLPYFSVSKKEGERSAGFTEDFSSVAAAASMVSKPPRPSKKSSSKREAKQQSKRGRKPKSQNISDPGPSTSAHTASAWTMNRTPDYSFQDEGEENLSMVTSPTGGHFSIYSHLTTPHQHYQPYQRNAEVEDKPDMDVLMNSSGCNIFELSGFRSPIPGYASEVVVEDGAVSQQAMAGDPLWSRAVSSDFSMGSPMYFGKHGMTVTSTPLKTPSYNVPLASECGASVFSPFHGMRQLNNGTPFMGYLADETNFLSPIKRSFTDTSGHNDSVEWSPSKLAMAWSPDRVRLGSVIIKTPQPIREALARSDLNRSNISPEDLASPGRLFSDASELIDGEMNGSAVQDALNVSGCSSVRVVTETPELLMKCRRRLTDQWSSVSFNSSGYASFLTPPSNSGGSGSKMETSGNF